MIETADSPSKYNFNGMSQEQVKEIWDNFESRWFNYSQNLSKLLNGNESSGRDAYYGQKVTVPETYGLNILTVKTNIMVAQSSLAALDARIRENPDGKPTKEQAAERKELTDDLRLAKRAMATVLSDWMLNHLFYPEKWNAKQLRNSAGPVDVNSLDEYLDLPEFAAQFKSEMQNVFATIDVKLKNVTTAIPAPRSDVPGQKLPSYPEFEGPLQATASPDGQ
jgi:hypothetical protein